MKIGDKYWTVVATAKGRSLSVRKNISSAVVPKSPRAINHFLFTPKNEPSEWVSDDNSKRDAFSKRFKVVKDKFNLGAKYGLYSFRHSFITNLFRYLRTTENKSYSEAIEFLQPITGHETREALERYIHTHDMDIPSDWSDKIDFIL